MSLMRFLHIQEEIQGYWNKIRIEIIFSFHGCALLLYIFVAAKDHVFDQIIMNLHLPI